MYRDRQGPSYHNFTAPENLCPVQDKSSVAISHWSCISWKYLSALGNCQKYSFELECSVDMTIKEFTPPLGSLKFYRPDPVS